MLPTNLGTKLNSMKVKQTAFFLIVAMIPLALVTYLLLGQFTSVLSEHTDREREKVTNLEANYIDDWLRNQLTSVEELIQKHPEFRTAKTADIVPILTVLEQGNPYVDVVSYIDKKGLLTNTQGSQLDGAGFANIQAVKERKTVQFSDITRHAANDRNTVFVDIPILDEQKEFAGGIQLEIDADKLVSLIRGIKLGETGHGFLLSKDGIYLAHPDDSKVGKRYDEHSDPETIEAFEKTVFSSNSGSVTYNYEGTRKIASFHTIETTGWKLLVAAPQDEVNQTVDKSRHNALLLIGVSLLGVAALAVYLSMVTVRPILEISRIMQAVAGGDLTNRVQEKGKDEIGQLKRNINEMLDTLSGMVRTISETTVQVAASSEQLTAIAQDSAQTSKRNDQTVQQVVKGADVQVETLGQTSIAMEEMAAGVQKVAGSASGISEAAQSTVEQVDQGNREVREAVEQMNQAAQSVKATSHAIVSLQEKSNEIRDTIGLIFEIANQTQLLALNASIEAARAGEHGRGFAVVAGEVKKLAGQTGKATEEIGRAIGEVLEAVERASKSMESGLQEVASSARRVEQTGGTFDRITASIHVVNDQIQEISAASQEMSAGAEEVSASLQEAVGIVRGSSTELNAVSRSITDQHRSMEEITDASESLSTMASELQELVGRFKVN
ncbi:methyl-accepting chemotaxis protein [Paenibacillus sp. J31TS4]|uniref:methyl-accepting chemotaxis protein n=1 Tax=Paenibacillus sp. J31TS4 TaxID=2807195 RepID=UPI001AFF3E3D|nr:methyl-accepting chemotaxis protein [Paenibacillus sp. J31TS4]GIP40206.1 methyl-accepting chemotaxis protein [Paenibacillus sp. J31TS4]